MIINFRRFSICIFFMLSVSLPAQIDNNAKIYFLDKKEQEREEKKTVTALYNLYNKGDEKKALKTARAFLKKAAYPSNIANLILLQAYYYNKRAVLDSSIYYTGYALKCSTGIADDSLRKRLFCLGYNLMGLNYKKKGLYQISKKWHLKGLEAAHKYKETNLYYTHLHGLAGVYKSLGDNDNAVKMYKECLGYKKDDEIVLGSYINLGDIYSDEKDYKKGSYYYNQGKLLSEKTNNQQAKAVLALNIGTNYRLQQKINDAIKMYNEAVLIADKNELNQIALAARGNIGEAYIDLKKYKKAKDIFLEALQKALNLGYLDDQIYFYDQLQKNAVLQNDYKNAFDYLTKSAKVKDSVNEIQKNKEINELEIKYNTAQREKQIVLLKKSQQLKSLEIKRQKETRSLMIFGFLIVLVPVVGLLFQYYQRLKTQRLLNIRQAEISDQNINALLKDQELKLIKAAISGQDKERQRISQELHDSIGGNLAAIKLQLNHLIIYEPPKIKNLISLLDETYHQVRSLSHTLMPKKFTQHKFCQVLESYLNDIGQASKIETVFMVFPREKADNLNEEIQLEIFRIIQELMNNTIKHAKASKIDLQINFVEEVVNILFEDNGIGFNPENYKSGIGFINLDNRMTKLNGSFIIDSQLKRGTIVNIEIPVLSESGTEKAVVKGIKVKKQLDSLIKL